MNSTHTSPAPARRGLAGAHGNLHICPQEGAAHGSPRGNQALSDTPTSHSSSGYFLWSSWPLLLHAATRAGCTGAGEKSPAAPSISCETPAAARHSLFSPQELQPPNKARQGHGVCLHSPHSPKTSLGPCSQQHFLLTGWWLHFPFEAPLFSLLGFGSQSSLWGSSPGPCGHLSSWNHFCRTAAGVWEKNGLSPREVKICLKKSRKSLSLLVHSNLSQHRASLTSTCKFRACSHLKPKSNKHWSIAA